MLGFCTVSPPPHSVSTSPRIRAQRQNISSASETVQKTSLGYAGGKPNPLNPPYQGDFPLNSPLIRGARGVKNDERWVSCTVSPPPHSVSTSPRIRAQRQNISSASETVQKTSLGYAGGKPNPLNPPYQGDLSLNSPLIRGARGVKNDERWVSCTVSPPPHSVSTSPRIRAQRQNISSASETVQKTSLGYAGGKPNPLNPPYQGDFPLNSPLIRGARGVKNDERWVSCTVSSAGKAVNAPYNIARLTRDITGLFSCWQM